MESEKPARVTRRLAVNLDKCTGCGACTYACSSARAGFFSPVHARIRILKLELVGVDAPVVCRQCEEPRCVTACAMKALVVNPRTGILEVDQARCIHCQLCTLACPYGAIFASPGGRDELEMLKCDLCGGQPECVFWCDTGALSLVEETDTGVLKKAAEDMLLVRQRFEIENAICHEGKG